MSQPLQNSINSFTPITLSTSLGGVRINSLAFFNSILYFGGIFKGNKYITVDPADPTYGNNLGSVYTSGALYKAYNIAALLTFVFPDSEGTFCILHIIT